MKTLVNILITGILIAAGVWIYNLPYSPCDTPLTYKIGFIDPRFNLKHQQVISDTQQAAMILNTAAGRKLFDYASGSGILTVNFIYDDRTRLNSEVNQLEHSLTRENSSLQQKIDKYEADVGIFEQKLADLNNTIRQYNSQGGAPPDVYADLTNRQNSLKAEGEALNTRARDLNLATRDYNSQVQNLNRNVSRLNEAISQKPESGLYESAGNTITIYFADDKSELVHTLAHEFGHALGLAHNSDPQSLMYSYTTPNLVLSREDLQGLDQICRPERLPVYWWKLFREKLSR